MIGKCEGIVVSEDSGVLRIQLDRPEKKNALTCEMYLAMASELQRANERDEIRAVLLYSAGDCFTSGNDLKDFLDTPPDGEKSAVMQFLFALSRLEKPVIAMVSGFAVGIGVTLLLHCDLVYASEDAWFQLPFVNLGLCAEGASSYLLPRLTGRVRAAELLLLGEPFSAETAYSHGIVNRVWSRGELFAEVEEVLHKLVSKPAPAVNGTKKLLARGTDRAVQQSLVEEMELFIRLLQTDTARQILSDLLNRSEP
ncbi:enoyl-CoA hydratase [Desulforhopalus singaporensis]|uniref:Enoyl-CoA hydratase n=1 Tax=Desulforhopalus singaporensis TaxID=91360 RepID=A0A1H0SR76_9BACT|nr:enoyl-CoA hydratase [Desulforhopalus singaporensis]SDP44251.1 Enoyl-CoA hydratase [Desulforhopalus singaporensis]